MKLTNFIIIFLIYSLNARAQSEDKSISLNLDFETLTNINIPSNWTIYSQGHVITLDSLESYNGNRSLAVQSKNGRLLKDSIAIVAHTILLPIKGKKVKLEGFLKLFDIEQKVGFCLVVNGKDGPVLATDMSDQNLKGSKSWSHYSVELEIPESATSIYFGIYQLGNGQLWADNLKLTIDNHNITEAEPNISKQATTKIESDKDSLNLKSFLARFGKVTMSNFLLKDSVSKVTRVPAVFGFDSFYGKYLNILGLPIIGSNKVSDEAFYKTREVLLIMLQKTPKFISKMIENNARIAIISQNELMTDLPEYRDYDKAINLRARGMGSTVDFPLTTFAEENILCLPIDRYKGEDISIHEFAHTLHSLALTFIDANFNEKLNDAFSFAIKQGLWKNTYAISSPSEYFAEGVQTWFNANKEENISNGIHNNIDTQEELKSYDPKLYKLISEYFNDKYINESCHQKEKMIGKWYSFPGHK